MCGIAGFWDLNAMTSSGQAGRIVRGMTDALRHRGPDSAGAWVDETTGIALGHRRLAIVDLSEHGHQPMWSASGRYVIVYNGEIYNFHELRAQQEARGCRFRGHSDTEVILTGFDLWGIEATIPRLSGMFAMAVWDREERRVVLARDPLGIKPLYWSLQGSLLLFASELRSLDAHPDGRREVDRDALGAYLGFGYVPAPRSIFQGVGKLEPGHMLTLTGDGRSELRCYWDLRAVARSPRQNVFIREDEALDALDGLMRRLVREHMIADVPLGAFLSGGIDSSAVVAIMQAESATPVKTFTIGFEEGGFNEAEHAKAVAAHLGTEHHELYLTARDALDLIPQIASYYDEPFADSSQIPTLLVSRMTREHVTVALTGDGGDELFGGYYRHVMAQRIVRSLGPVPVSVRRLLAGAIRTVPASVYDRLLSSRISNAGHKVHKVAAAMAFRDDTDLYRRVVRLWEDGPSAVPGARPLPSLTDDPELRRDFPDFTERMQYIDMATYMVDDVLTKVDRATMAVSLEARVPLLDHRMVEFAWRVPASMKIRDGKGKWLLRQLLYRHVPQSLSDRPKMGFGVPIEHWLRGELRPWAEELLSLRALRETGLFDPARVRMLWEEHQSGRCNWHHQLWSVLMAQSWSEARRTAPSALPAEHPAR